MPQLDIEYEGALLSVDITSDEFSAPISNANSPIAITESPDVQVARLYVNALLRDQAKLARQTGTLRLSTSLQTDYEWHEHVESVITLNDNEVIVSLSANQHELVRQTFPRTHLRNSIA